MPTLSSRFPFRLSVSIQVESSDGGRKKILRCEFLEFLNIRRRVLRRRPFSLSVRTPQSSLAFESAVRCFFILLEMSASTHPERYRDIHRVKKINTNFAEAGGEKVKRGGARTLQFKHQGNAHTCKAYRFSWPTQVDGEAFRKSASLIGLSHLIAFISHCTASRRPSDFSSIVRIRRRCLNMHKIYLIRNLRLRIPFLVLHRQGGYQTTVQARFHPRKSMLVSFYLGSRVALLGSQIAFHSGKLPLRIFCNVVFREFPLMNWSTALGPIRREVLRIVIRDISMLPSSSLRRGNVCVGEDHDS